jgi:hypothetical protein
MVQDVQQLFAGQTPVERQEGGAEAVGGEDELDELRAVVQEQGDDVAAADAARGEDGGEGVDTLIELAPAHVLRAGAEHLAVRRSIGVVAQDGTEVQRRHPG